MKSEEIPRRDFVKSAVASATAVGAIAAAAPCQARGAASAEDTAATPAPDAKVPRKKLGKTGVEVPILLMGTCQQLDPKYDKRLHRAYKLGVDWIDTARMYDNYQSHKTIAPFIKQIGDRKKLLLSSKAHIKPEEATAAKFLKGVDSCLAELETDYLDVFFIHMAHSERYLDPEFITMGEDLKKSGKSRFFGISCHDGSVPRMLNKAASLGGGVDAIMFNYNFHQFGDKELNKAIDACKKAGIGLIAIKTLAAIPNDAEELVPWTSKDFTLTQAKLKSVWADERIDSIASQMGNVQHVMENAAAAMSPVQLSMADYVQLNRLAALTAPQYCTGCNHICESRVAGDVRIADILRYRMYHNCYREQDAARGLYRALRPCERDPEGVDFTEAVAACPQGIDIPERLAEAKRILSA